MPPPRRQPPPPPGESKTGLVVALVIFVLLTLISGGLAYMFYSETAAAVAKAAEADKKLAEMKTLRDQQALRRILLAKMVGLTPVDQDTTDFSSLRQDAKTFDPELSRLAGDLTKRGVQWNPA